MPLHSTKNTRTLSNPSLFHQGGSCCLQWESDGVAADNNNGFRHRAQLSTVSKQDFQIALNFRGNGLDLAGKSMDEEKSAAIGIFPIKKKLKSVPLQH